MNFKSILVFTVLFLMLFIGICEEPRTAQIVYELDPLGVWGYDIEILEEVIKTKCPQVTKVQRDGSKISITAPIQNLSDVTELEKCINHLSEGVFLLVAIDNNLPKGVEEFHEYKKLQEYSLKGEAAVNDYQEKLLQQGYQWFPLEKNFQPVLIKNFDLEKVTNFDLDTDVEVPEIKLTPHKEINKIDSFNQEETIKSSDSIEQQSQILQQGRRDYI